MDLEREQHLSVPQADGPGPFLTHVVEQLAQARHRVATSRRHRKRLPPHEIGARREATALPVSKRAAFGHLLAPKRIGWWIALLFAVGASLFLLGVLATARPQSAPEKLPNPKTVGRVFFVGSLFFTSAACLQWLEAVNADVRQALHANRPAWRWFAWRPRDLGYLAASVQLVGTLLFNVNTADSMVAGLSWRQQDLYVWTPNMLGSICFLVASGLAYAEVTHGRWRIARHNISWWIAAVNALGSIAFQLSAATAFVGPTESPRAVVMTSVLLTAAGAACFLTGAYLLVPELFDTD